MAKFSIYEFLRTRLVRMEVKDLINGYGLHITYVSNKGIKTIALFHENVHALYSFKARITGEKGRNYKPLHWIARIRLTHQLNLEFSKLEGTYIV